MNDEYYDAYPNCWQGGTIASPCCYGVLNNSGYYLVQNEQLSQCKDDNPEAKNDRSCDAVYPGLPVCIEALP